MKRPDLTVIAGPNGSGKSTLTDYLKSHDVDFGYYINADEIVKSQGLVGEAGSKTGQLAADLARDDCLKKGIDFSFETVMSHESKVDFMRRCYEANYRITLFFVATLDPQINIERVKNRVAKGGHPVPENKIISRYYRSIALLPKAVLYCDTCHVFDNSSNGAGQALPGLRPVISIARKDHDKFVVKISPTAPVWAMSSTNLEIAGVTLIARNLQQDGDLLLLYGP